jgi:tetratricopeptide (TPR) repeat protein
MPILESVTGFLLSALNFLLWFCGNKPGLPSGKIDMLKSTTVLIALIAFALGPAASPAAAQSQPQIDWCVNATHGFSIDQQISGCTAAIQSHKWRGRDIAWAFNNRGFAYYLKRYIDPAFEDFEQAIRLDPKNAVAFNNRGLVYQAKGDVDRAIADFNETIRLDPTYIFAFNNRGGAYMDKNEYDRAIADYSEATRLDPTFAVAFRARGNAYFVTRDFDRAIADYDQAIKLNPKYAAAFYNRGLTYQLNGDLDRAITDYNEAIRLDPKDAMTFNNRGNTYQLKGNPDRAIADYSEAIRLDPKESGIYLNRGLANLYSGKLAEALADLNQSSELNPKNAYAALWREIVAKRSNLPSRLTQAMAQIDMTKWPAPVIRLYLGQIMPEAVLAAADDPNTSTKKSQVCEADFFNGELALQRGAKDEAVHLFQRAAAGCGKNTHVWAHANAELRALGAQP